jgi:hypothetical protein
MAFKVNNGPEQEQEVFHLHARVIMSHHVMRVRRIMML